jgi:hypothetical protein
MPYEASEDFKIFVDPSCLSTPMEEDRPVAGSLAANVGASEEQGLRGEGQKEAAVEEGTINEPAPVQEVALQCGSAEGKAMAKLTHPPVKSARSSIAAPIKDDAIGANTEEAEGLQRHIEDHTPIPEEEFVNATPGTEKDWEDEPEEDDSTPRPSQMSGTESALTDASATTDGDSLERRGSLRTEALIHAAARAVVARMERHVSGQVPAAVPEDENILSSATTSELLSGDMSENMIPTASDISEGDAGDSSSQHEVEDDDVFSDRSLRSSLGSVSGLSKHSGPDDQDLTSKRSPRVSGISGISELSGYDKEDFVPTVRGTPRMPFRTPSDVRAMQLASPTPSVISGASPRPNKRHTIVSSGGFPTVSRLGSPGISAQYSPKGRSTPSRLKVRKEPAPLVLLHVTLLPLRWSWGATLDKLDSMRESDMRGFAPSEQFKALRVAWHQLQERVGDTVLERGILLPHPQNDFELLEERMLEALELPLRRRARILECGHYLGPSNESSLGDGDDVFQDDESSEYGLQTGMQAGRRTHWCSTCRGEVRFEALGEGRVFRVKVYASNGLMKAGAWDACWKEMERVDVELEPVTEAAVRTELECLANLLAEEEIRQERERQEAEEALDADPDTLSPPPNFAPSPALMPSPQRLASTRSPVLPSSHSMNSSLRVQASGRETRTSRRRRDEERLREIYGHTPPPPQTEEMDTSAHRPHPDSYIPPPSPPSPSEEVLERREQRRRSYQALSLPELALEAIKVLMRDRKNVVIAVMGLMVLMLSVKPAPGAPNLAPASLKEKTQDVMAAVDEAEWKRIVNEAKLADTDEKEHAILPALEVTLEKAADEIEDLTSVMADDVVKAAEGAVQDVIDEMKETSLVGDQAEVPAETVTEKVRVFETITETETVKVSVSNTISELESSTTAQKTMSMQAMA